MYLDLIFLVGSAIAFWQMAGSGYQVVLAPEGVAQSSVAYQAFLAPVCLWLGVGLLTLRLWDRGLARGRGVLTWLARPLAGRLAGAVSASLRRQRALVTARHRPGGAGRCRSRRRPPSSTRRTTPRRASTRS